MSGTQRSEERARNGGEGLPKRIVYLVRHGHPAVPLGERWCLGHTDLPLAPVGRMQAALLPFLPELCLKPVFSSYLTRAVETARPLCPEPMIREGLEEQNLGEWDGLPFSEIMIRWPALYEAREQNPDVWPESAETTEAVRERMRAAVLGCLKEAEDSGAGTEIVVVSHKSAIASLTGQRKKLNHCSVSVLEWDGETLRPAEVGRVPHPELTEEVCLALLKAAGTPEHVVTHCRAVTKKAMELLDRLEAERSAEVCPPTARKPARLNRSLLFAAAMLHDIARTEPDHAAVGAAWVKTLGYPDVAEVIAQHHDFDDASLCESAEEAAAEHRRQADAGLSEAALLYLADKYVQGEREVTLDERFEASRKKCATEEALRAHDRRYRTARRLETLLNRS